ncbi:MAG: DUF4426 domain-containing protein [Motiliproteus sp.]
MRRFNLTTALSLVLTLIVSVLSASASAEQFKAVDHFKVHYNALNTTFLTPEVAATYSIKRSKVRGLINVAVLDSDAGDQAVTAVVGGEVVNLVGQAQALDFRLVREGTAIYYIAEFRFTNDEVLRFNLNVQPDPNKPAQPVNFEQHFYVD